MLPSALPPSQWPILPLHPELKLPVTTGPRASVPGPHAPDTTSVLTPAGGSWGRCPVRCGRAPPPTAPPACVPRRWPSLEDSLSRRMWGGTWAGRGLRLGVHNRGRAELAGGQGWWARQEGGPRPDGSRRMPGAGSREDPGPCPSHRGVRLDRLQGASASTEAGREEGWEALSWPEGPPPWLAPHRVPGDPGSFSKVDLGLPWPFPTSNTPGPLTARLGPIVISPPVTCSLAWTVSSMEGWVTGKPLSGPFPWGSFPS